MRAKLVTVHTQAAKEAVMDMPKTDYAAASADLKDASHHYVENSLTKMSPTETLNNFYLKNLERRSQASKFMDAFKQRVINSKTFMRPLATFVERTTDNTIDEWRLAARESTHNTNADVVSEVVP